VTIIKVSPLACKSPSSESTSNADALSKLPVGSSASTMPGSFTSARAIATRWR
jgi:hypothetical protein